MDSPYGDYDALIRPLEERMIRSVWRVVQNTADAEDAFQDALATIWRRIDRVRTHRNPEALVLKICIDSACDVLRRKARVSRREESVGLAAALAGDDDDVSAPICEHEQRVEVARAIARLPEQQAAAVTMRHLLDRPYDEIAAALDCAEATARVHVARGLQRLGTLLAHLNPTMCTERT
ncbi:MAG: RNA polymerase sigma factor [Planctomycetaceae bacterium]